MFRLLAHNMGSAWSADGLPMRRRGQAKFFVEGDSGAATTPEACLYPGDGTVASYRPLGMVPVLRCSQHLSLSRQGPASGGLAVVSCPLPPQSTYPSAYLYQMVGLYLMASRARHDVQVVKAHGWAVRGQEAFSWAADARSDAISAPRAPTGPCRPPALSASSRFSPRVASDRPGLPSALRRPCPR
jgi:hypothetical protein